MKKQKIRFFSWFDILLVLLVIVFGFTFYFPSEDKVLNMKKDIYTKYPILSNTENLDNMYSIFYYSEEDYELKKSKTDGDYVGEMEYTWVSTIEAEDGVDSEYVKISEDSYQELYKELGKYNVKKYRPTGSWVDHIEITGKEPAVLAFSFNTGEHDDSEDDNDKDNIYISVYENYIDINLVLYEFVDGKFDMEWVKSFSKKNLNEIDLTSYK